VPTIAALRGLGEDVVEQVLRENEPRWESLSDADRERVGVLARAIVQRMLHEPTLRLKGAVNSDSAYVYVQALRELFGLELGSALDEPAGAEVTQLDSRRRKQT
jgi:glutamyl-tRNA reductase